MDRGPLPPRDAPAPTGRPEGCRRIALVLQGGGALGAYQGGVYQALHEAALEPDWIAGVSIGGINGAIIAGNPPERRLERLRQFWDIITARPTSLFVPDGDNPRRLANAWSSMLTMALGQPAFFTPNVPNPWISPRGSATATSFYDNAPLKKTLREMVDFDYLNHNGIRYACGSVNVRSGNFVYFDTAETIIQAEHVMASGALPPALPMMQVGTDWFWDGGLVSNTPLQHVFENIGTTSTLVFQVDLFSARGPLPRDMGDVLARQKDIQYSSRTRLVSDLYMQRYKQNLLIKRLLDKLPEADLTAEEIAMKADLQAQPEINLLQLIYRQAAYETQASDYEFSTASMREHWNSGYRDTYATLQHKEWMAMPNEEGGIRVHDVHNIES
ncbi:MAG TPA: patatin-like phospholipase family protein [Acetobacteraceae bacterium]|jgi:NTE family protein|nr:patatin-like phospholipase family protein [Acetobacteraceae bacterium]